MLLCVSVGNTNTAISVFDNNDNQLFLSRIATDKSRSQDQYSITIRDALDLYGVNKNSVDGAIISSVVPPVTQYIKESIRMFFGITPLIVGPGVKTGLNIITEDPAQLGSDIVADAVAAINKYEKPAIVIDMGTATVISAINAEGRYLGCAILPGVHISLDALSDRTAQLPHISIEAPDSVIGTNSIDAMRSGIVFGNSGMIDGMIDRMSELLGGVKSIVATGGNSKFIVPHSRHNIVYDENLLMEGLLIIYRRNIKI